MGKIGLATTTLILTFSSHRCSSNTPPSETPLEKVFRIAMTSRRLLREVMAIRAAWCGLWFQRSNALKSGPPVRADDGNAVFGVREAESGGLVQIQLMPLDSGVLLNVYLDLAP